MEQIDVKIGTKDEALWIELKDKTEGQIEGIEKALKVNKAILKMAEKKIKREQWKSQKQNTS